MPQIINVEHHLRQQPVVRSIRRCVDKVRACNVRFDCQWQEIAGCRMDEEECLTGTGVMAGIFWQKCMR